MLIVVLFIKPVVHTTLIKLELLRKKKLRLLDTARTLLFNMYGVILFSQRVIALIDKLPPWSHKHVFLGYSRTQKGYWCYSPESRPYFVNADVTHF